MTSGEKDALKFMEKKDLFIEKLKELYESFKDVLTPEDKSYFESRFKKWQNEGLDESPVDVKRYHE